MKLAEVKPLIDKLVAELPGVGCEVDPTDVRLALETAFVAGVRSGLKFTSSAKFAEVFGAAATPNGRGGKAEK